VFPVDCNQFTFLRAKRCSRDPWKAAYGTDVLRVVKNVAVRKDKSQKILMRARKSLGANDFAAAKTVLWGRSRKSPALAHWSQATRKARGNAFLKVKDCATVLAHARD
jgi:hypothetical protein